METSTAKIVSRLLADGWSLHRNGGKHDVYIHPKLGVTQVPRHLVLSPGVARSIAKKAGWS